MSFININSAHFFCNVLNCFADNFRFQLDKSEFDNLKSQSVISSWGQSLIAILFL